MISYSSMRASLIFFGHLWGKGAYLQNFKLTFKITFGNPQLDTIYPSNYVGSGGTEQTFKMGLFTPL